MPSEEPKLGTPRRGTAVLVPSTSIFSSSVMSERRLSIRVAAGSEGSRKGYCGFVCWAEAVRASASVSAGRIFSTRETSFGLSRRWYASELVDLFRAAGHEVHEQIVAESLGRGEVGLAAAHGGDLLHELDELEVVGEHEGVDHDVGTLAAANLF